MEQNKPSLYRAQEFTAMAGVTVCALHHYNRLGLLRPVRHEANGYRLYSQNDLGRLEQILVLIFLGLPLKQIKELLCEESGLPTLLQHQHGVLMEKSRRIRKAIAAIGAALESMASSGSPDWQFFRIIDREIEMQHDTDWTMKYCSEEAKARVEQRKGLCSSEQQEKVSRVRSDLFRDVESVLGEDPAGPGGTGSRPRRS